MNTSPSTVELKAIGQAHPDVASSQIFLKNLTLLYKGGKMLKDNATGFLARHSKELRSNQ